MSADTTATLTGAKRRILERLKRVDSATASELAEEFGLTDTAVRQHLDALEAGGLAERRSMPAVGRGRPPVNWALTAQAAELFPDRHGELTVELIDAIRTTLGDEALDRVVQQRASRQLDSYRTALGASTDIAVRVRRLSELRSDEGYLADVVTSHDDGNDELVLVEHHCPISAAAGACIGLCSAELDLFQQALGSDVVVERVQHLLAGDARCAYRITPRNSAG